jgi:nitrate/nitrite transporter NarK
MANSSLVAAHEFFRKGEANAEGWSMLIARSRDWERAYRDRWRHDKVVRSTHGVGAARVLYACFAVVTLMALVLAAAYEDMVPLTIACLTLGLGMGAVFKLVPQWFPDKVGAVTGVVSAAGGLGGFFPPLVMGVVESATGGFALGFILMAAVALACLLVLISLGRSEVSGRLDSETALAP